MFNAIMVFKVHVKQNTFWHNFTAQYVNKLTVNVKVPQNKNLVVILAPKTAHLFAKKWPGDWDKFIVQFVLVT